MKNVCKRVIAMVVFLLGSMSLYGCDLLQNAYQNIVSAEKEVIGGNIDIEDEYETGAWNDGMFWCGDYQVNLEFPQAGHPSGTDDSEWSTGYELDDGTNVNVDFFSREGSMEDRISELENQGFVVEEGVLWENSCYFYSDDAELATIALVKADENNYIEIAFESWEEAIVPFDEIPDVFTLSITK